MLRVKLERYKRPAFRSGFCQEFIITECPPYFQTRAATRVHRVRAGAMFFHNNEYSHSAFVAWCGQHGLTSNGLILTDDPPCDMPVCATCEGRAIGAGQTESTAIAGRPVIFSPRR